MSSFHVLGLMSGTSLDGLDMALCRFSREEGRWQFKVLASDCVPYPEEWAQRLKALPESSGLELALAHAAYGWYLGESVRRFLQQCGQPADLVASHGHTVFHQPDKGLTFQLGSGAEIAAVSGVDTVCDFRTTDVALGGQGAPLVPIGDELLFGDYDYCLNIGGIANISYSDNGRRTAFDICPANIVLNALSKTLGSPYDKDGLFAQQGQVNETLLARLDALDYYRQAPPKSIGREWVEEKVFPLLRASSAGIYDQLRTFSEHIAGQVIKCCLEPVKQKGMLATGGGAFNTFLIDRMNALRPDLRIRVTPENAETIKFKEAIIFAFLGLLRWQGQVNALASVTGASRDNSGGCIYRGK